MVEFPCLVHRLSVISAAFYKLRLIMARARYTNSEQAFNRPLFCDESSQVTLKTPPLPPGEKDF